MNRLFAPMLIILLLAAGCRGAEDPEVAADTVSPVAEPLLTNTAPFLARTEAGMTIVVVLEDNVIGMPTDGIPAGPVVFTVSNAGTQIHSFAVQGPAVDARLRQNLGRNEEESMEVVFQAGSYRAWCPLHEDLPGEEVQFEVAPAS